MLVPPVPDRHAAAKEEAVKILSCLMLTCAVLAGAVQADTLVIPDLRGEPPNSAQGVPRPARGMSMDQVVKKFGEPKQRLAAVGDPPISRWIYDRYTVYFERQTVLHSVVTAH